MKAAKKALIIIAVVFAVLLIGRNFFVKFLVEAGTRAVVGTKMDIGKLNIGLINPLVQIRDMKLYNPKGFEDDVMVEIPEIYVDYSLKEILTGDLYLPEMRIDLKEFVVVKNKEGKVNLQELKIVKEQSKEKETPKPEAKKEKTKPKKVRIDNLSLKMGKVVFKDYSREGEPSVKEFNINLDERYENIGNLNAVATMIVVKVLTKTTIGSLTNIDVVGLKDSLSGAMEGVSQAAGKAVTKTTETAKEAVEKSKDTLKKTTEDLKNLIPFGQK